MTFGRQMVRYESTAAQKATEAAKQTASKASATASEYTSKASEGLSRVQSAAGPAIVNYAKGVQSALGRIGGRTGKLIAFVERTAALPPFVLGDVSCPSAEQQRIGGRCHCCPSVYLFRAQWLTETPGQVPFVIYYTKVGLEAGKIVLRGQKITAPP